MHTKLPSKFIEENDIMQLKITITAFFVLLTYLMQAQEIEVKDTETKKSIENVFVYDITQTHTALTNKSGIVDLKDFSLDDSIIFQHPSYEMIVIRKNDILGSKVELKSRMVNLEKIIISASKWEQPASEVPNKIMTIKAAQIAFDNPQTAADMLSKTGEVFVQKSQLGGGSPMIRGFSANSILLVIDGVRMNNLIYRSGNLQNIITIDPNTIESSEVIFGPGSIMYGSDALGGVMDFHTKSPEFTGSPNAVHGNAMLRYSSANNETTGHLDLNYEKKNWAFLTSITHADFDDLKMGSNGHEAYQRTSYVVHENGEDIIRENTDPNTQKFTQYNQTNFLQKVRFRPHEKLVIDYAFHYTTSSDIPRYDRLIQPDGDGYKYAEWYYGPQEFMMNAINAKINQKTKYFDRIKITLAQQSLEESRIDRKFGSTSKRARTENVNTYNLYADFEKSFTSSSFLFYGVEAVVNTLDSKAKTTDIVTGETSATATRYPDGENTYQSYALYTMYKNNLNKKFTLQTGLRYNYVDLHSTFDNTTFYNLPFEELNTSNGALSGSLGGVYRTGKQWEFHINTSTGFRAPNVDDMAKVFDSEPGEVIVPNDNLKPEYAYNTDFSIRKSFKNKASFEATIFYTYLDNAMVRRAFTLNGQDSIMYDDELSEVNAIVNAGYANIYGASFHATAKLTPCLSLEGSYTYTDGEDNDNLPLRHVSPTFGIAKLMFQKKKTKVALIFNYNGEISYEDLAESEQSKTYMYATDEEGNPYSPSWTTLDMSGSYPISEAITLNAGIENIFDIRYRPYSSGIVAPGRNFRISLSGKI